jgi:hypothetical protein
VLASLEGDLVLDLARGALETEDDLLGLWCGARRGSDASDDSDECQRLRGQRVEQVREGWTRNGTVRGGREAR